MDINRFLTLFSILSLFFSIHSYAAQYIGCNNCSQYQMYQLARDTAESHVDIGGFNDDIYVVDIKNAKVHGWRISASYRFDTNGELDVNSSASSISVPIEVLQEVKEASKGPIFAEKKLPSLPVAALRVRGISPEPVVIETDLINGFMTTITPVIWLIHLVPWSSD